jgi:hypothetical protein
MTDLSPEQLKVFEREGFLVVDDFLSSEELQEAHEGLATTLAAHGVDVHDLEATGTRLSALSSTNGSGGVLDLFYDEWKLKIALHPQLFRWTQQLWKAAYCHGGEEFADLEANEEGHRWHPYGSFDSKEKGYAYIDRLGYRLPSSLSDALGQRVPLGTTKKSRKKKRSLQRSLTPHLDCCPDTFDNPIGKSKWRPIQCLVSLTDNRQANTGGLEVATGGFHRQFRSWARQRAPTVLRDREGNPISTEEPPCLGEYTHMRPKEDVNVMDRVQHVDVRAGSVVFWDNRLPHANAYRHNGDEPRAVVYCSFLPPAPLNRNYAQGQLRKWFASQNPTDQWIASNGYEDEEGKAERDGARAKVQAQLDQLPTLSRQLLAVEPW